MDRTILGVTRPFLEMTGSLPPLSDLFDDFRDDFDDFRGHSAIAAATPAIFAVSWLLPRARVSLFVSFRDCRAQFSVVFSHSRIAASNHVAYIQTRTKPKRPKPSF
jgi:hypothetical protein